MKLSIGKKLGLAFGALLFITAIMTCFAIFNIQRVNDSVDELKSNYIKAYYGQLASKAVDDVALSVRMIALLHDESQITAEKQKIQEARARYGDAIANLDKIVTSEKGKELLAASKVTIKPAAEMNNKVISLAMENKRDEAAALLLHDGIPLTKKVQDGFAEFSKYRQERVDAAYARAEAVCSISRISQIICGALSLILGISLGFFLTRNLSSRLKYVARAMSDVSGGDLSKSLTVRGNDEIAELGDSINNMISSMSAMLLSITKASGGVAESANMLSVVSDQMTLSLEEVSSRTTSIATASEEMTATSLGIAQSCNMAADSSKQGSELASQGACVVQETITGMNRIADRVKETSGTLDKLGVRSEQVGDIVETISDIADQTNLLALNAAIEAARAGEQGRGFAVVADEVRALAERTTKATKEISQMIKAIQGDTKGAVVSMNEGVREAEKGTSGAAQSGDALNDILNQISNVTTEIHQIATAAEEQTATTSEITSNIQQITEVVQLTASCSRDQSSAARELLDHTGELRQLVGKFIVAEAVNA